MTRKTALLDVNVVMYAAGKLHDYRPACAWVMSEITEGSIDAAIDAEAIQEILYRYCRTQQWTVAAKMASNLISIVPRILPIQQADVILCASLCGQYGPHGLSVRDLIHVAVMQSNGLDTIISTDQGFDRIDGIHRVDPLDLFKRQAK